MVGGAYKELVMIHEGHNGKLLMGRCRIGCRYCVGLSYVK